MLERYNVKMKNWLTRMETQWAHTIPVMTVPINPKRRPLFLNARGTDKMPEPKLPLNM